MSILLKFWKQIAVLVLLVGSFVGGYIMKKCDKNPQAVVTKNATTQTKSNKVKEKVTKKVDKNGNPIVITERTTDKSVTNEKENISISTKKTNYSLGFSAIIDPYHIFKQPDYNLQVGKRLGDSDFWGTAGYQIGNQNISFGVRWEF